MKFKFDPPSSLTCPLNSGKVETAISRENIYRNKTGSGRELPDKLRPADVASHIVLGAPINS